MKCKVLKKYYDPFEKVTKRPGEVVEIPEGRIEAYSPYVYDIEAPMPEKTEAKAPTIEEAKAAPSMRITERAKPAKKKVK